MEENYYGADGSFIPRDKIPFDFTILKNNDIIENQDKTSQLMYFEKDKSYRLVTNSFTEFLSTRQLQQKWIKL